MKNVVLDFLKTLNDEDFNTARQHVNDDLKFEGVLGSRDGAEDYFADMRRMKFKYEIKKSFADGNDVCIFYDITMSGITLFSCGWYGIKNTRISSIRVIFDPRLLLELPEKNSVVNTK